jgi:hypothetical protein
MPKRFKMDAIYIFHLAELGLSFAVAGVIIFNITLQKDE